MQISNRQAVHWYLLDNPGWGHGLRLPGRAADPQIAGQGPELMRKLSIMGALALYLDFLNLFYYLLRLLGRNR